MIYLNNAATSWPKPEAVYEALDHYTRYYGAGFGRGNDPRAKESSETVYDCRCEAAELLGIQEPERVIFTANATHAINIAVKGVLKAGDHVVMSDMEHNAVVRPIMKLQARGIISVSVVKSDEHGRVQADAVNELLRPNTALVELVHVSNVTGALNDVATIGALCRRAGVTFMIDASQSAGSVTVDAARQYIDILVAPGHKGLLGPVGTGILYFAPRVEADTLFEGGTGSDSLKVEQPARPPERFEVGTMNLPGIAALLEGLRFVTKQGIQAIAGHKQRLVERLHSALSRIEGFRSYSPFEARPTLLAFNIGDSDSVELAEYLADCGISVRGGFHCSASVHAKYGTLRAGMVRISPGVFSTNDDIDSCADAVLRFASLKGCGASAFGRRRILDQRLQ